ncbi:hypothetical protein [Psychrobacillus phage Perkons]|nr:hypothetical protein [Psychrobacillus phage Perkons]
MNKKQKFYKGRAIIQPFETYDIEGVDYKIISATSEIIGESKGGIGLTELVFLLENTETEERWYMKESELQKKFIEQYYTKEEV